MISKRRDCRGGGCTIVLHGGVCYRTSTQHKWGNNYDEEEEEEEYED